ncbi:hypothetical protein [Naasia lichenicola]|uniref:Uncharacterized protein n=1 Tax=Naasia lichenicola TaxID=2565933 RepID=A0A4V3WTL5_9MICO|nr:hypothetical protein [Naasia lichenicola]THG32377.1 hypothetical protein E6C64_05000 [Naasia lichenicola]
MADFRRYLPLSNREPVDESGVTGDWRPLTSQSLMALADLLESLPPDAWSSDSMRPSRRPSILGGPLRDDAPHESSGLMTVTAVAERLAHRVESTTFELLFPTLLVGSDPRSPDQLVAALRDAAAALTRRGVRDLTEVMLAACDIAHALGIELPPIDSSAGVAGTRPVVTEAAAANDSVTSVRADSASAPPFRRFDTKAFGAAVLARAATSSPAIRSIVQQRTLAPTDSSWRIGSGPDIRATSAVLLLWVAGRDVRPVFA